MNFKLSTVMIGWLTLIGFGGVEAATVNMTTTHGMVSGTVLEGSPEVHAFHGVPFAKPPVGELRFKPPEPRESWTGVKDATQLSSSCWQVEDTSFDRFSGVEMWNPNTDMSEDCLYLNAWIPVTTTRKPIIVWIYGGGFWSGTSTLDVYNAHQLAATQDVIVVSMNYRLGALGFLYTGTDDSPGNAGLLDQVLALKWIKDNAANMGGDPDKITLIGESAGAVSIGLHLLSPLSQDFFNNAIMMSGSPTAFWAIQTHSEAKKRAELLAADTGCSDSDTDEMVECLRQADPAALVGNQWNHNQYYLQVPMGPVVDGYFLPRHPDELMADGMVKNSSIITGVVKDEGTFWLIYGFPDVFKQQDPPRPISASEYKTVVNGVVQAMGDKYTLDTVKKLALMKYYDTVQPWKRTNYLDAIDDISGDTLFKCAVVDFAKYYSNDIGGNVYQYSFEHRVSTNTWPEWLGVAHGYEIEFFLGLPLLQPQNYTVGERELSMDVMNMISNFAQTGDPNTGNHALPVAWPKYTPEQQQYLVINENNTHVDQGLRYEACTFWAKEVSLFQEYADEVENARRASANASNDTKSIGLLVTLLITFLVLKSSRYV